MSYADEYANSHTVRQSDLKAAGVNQASVKTADINHYLRLLTLETKYPGNSNGALNALRELGYIPSGVPSPAGSNVT
jgi:hypothetical protein